jgi:hypothetical protein
VCQSGSGRPNRKGDLSERQLDAERRPFAHAAFDVHLAAVRLDDVLDDGEAEAGAAFVPRAAFVDAVEALEDARHGFRRDACRCR